MSTRKSLRKVSQEKLSRDEIEAALEALHDEPDYVAVITAAALAEGELENLIISKLKQRDVASLKEIFSNRGPLSDFHSKILIARAFGIITTPLAEDLLAIKAVRNAFAHARKPLSFDHPAVEAEILALKMGVAMRKAGAEGKWKFSNRQWYLLQVKITLIIFATFASHGETADDLLKKMLEGSI